MSTTRTNRGADIAAWWHAALADRDSGSARALAARLRRAGGVEALSEQDVHALARRLDLRPQDAGRLVRLVRTLAEIRESDHRSLAQHLGGASPVLSALRFQRLLRARDDEFVDALRRAVVMAERRCNVAALGADLLLWDHPEWGDKVRARWCFDYFGAAPPEAQSESNNSAEEAVQ